MMVSSCATTSGSINEDIPVAGGGTCDASIIQDLIGETATQDLAADAMARSGAREFRWIPPNSAVTMDYRETRLNMEYDEGSVVRSIRCG